MKRLILMRHAKSDWSALTASDHERTLNARGIESAQAIGDWLRQEGMRPDHILCSDAARTQETLAHLKLPETPTTLTRELYLAEPEAMLHILRQQSADCILMLAHNPGSAILAEQLLQRLPDDEEFDRFPTCATLVAEFEIEDWSKLEIGTGTSRNFIVPRRLID